MNSSSADAPFSVEEHHPVQEAHFCCLDLQSHTFSQFKAIDEGRDELLFIKKLKKY